MSNYFSQTPVRLIWEQMESQPLNYYFFVRVAIVHENHTVRLLLLFNIFQKWKWIYHVVLT